MSWYLTVNPSRMNDDRIRACSLLARHLWAHFLASELATKLPGLIRGGLGTISEQVGESTADTLAALEELRTANAIEFDLDARIVRMIGVALEDFEIPAKSTPTVSGWLRVARDQPRCEVVARHAEEFAELCPSRADDWAAVAGRCRRQPVPRALSALPKPSGSPPVALPVADHDLDPDPDQDPDLDPPLPPKGGNEGTRVGGRVLIADDERTQPEVTEALVALAEAREEFGLPAMPPSARIVREAVRRLRERDAVAMLPVFVRRHAAQVRQAWAAGRDERQTLHLRGVVRRIDALAVDPAHEQARAPPASQALADPKANDF